MTCKTRHGFTIFEFLIVSFILGATLAIFAQGFMALNKDYKVLASYLSSYLKGREVMDIVSKDCRVAIRVMDNYAGYSTTNNCLVLKVPSVDASGNIIDINKKFDYIIYRINNKDLWKTVIPGIGSSRTAYNNALKRSIESLYFAYNETGLSSVANKTSIAHLTIWVSIAETILQKTYRVNPGTTVKLMNYEWEFVR